MLEADKKDLANLKKGDVLRFTSKSIQESKRHTKEVDKIDTSHNYWTKIVYFIDGSHMKRCKKNNTGWRFVTIHKTNYPTGCIKVLKDNEIELINEAVRKGIDEKQSIAELNRLKFCEKL